MTKNVTFIGMDNGLVSVLDSAGISPHETLDLAAEELRNYPAQKCPLRHIFTPGLYIREITMPKGTMVVSKEHKTTHPYFIQRGLLAVYNTADDFLGYKCVGQWGVTTPGTRRLLKICEETVWITVHPMDFITGEENDWDEAKKKDLVERLELLLVGSIVDEIYK